MGRRQKILYVGYDQVVALLGLSQNIERLRLDCLAGSNVSSVHNDWSRRAFGIVLENDSWPEVPDGAELLVIDSSNLEGISIPEPIQLDTFGRVKCVCERCGRDVQI